MKFFKKEDIYYYYYYCYCYYDFILGAVSGITRVIQDLETSEDASIEHILEEVERGNLEFLDKYFSKTRSGVTSHFNL